MYTVTKTFRYPCGHRLFKNESLCKNLHGHNLKILVTVSSDRLNEKDMVIDFSDLKNVVNDLLKDWDHCLFLNENDPMVIKEDIKVITVPEGKDPTAEVLSEMLYKKISEKLNSEHHLLYVAIWENEDSVASYGVAPVNII